MDLFRKCLDPVEKVLKDSKISKSEIHEIVLVGGSTRIPKLQEMMNNYAHWQSEIKNFNLTSEKMVLAYMELFNSLISRRDSIIKNRQIWRNIPVMLFNQIPL